MPRYSLRIVTIIFLMPFYASANSLVFNLTDNKNNPLANAVVYALPLSGNKSGNKQKTPPKKATINQRNKTFRPYVSVFEKGTVATFLNQDSVKHHVYSFSTPKKFEIKLYSGKPPKTIVFDKPGMVTLGCNIHDEMLAYAFIVDTPYFALSNNKGRAVLNGLPNGQYLMKVEHPQQKKGVNIQQKINLPSKTNNLSFKLALKPQWKKHKKRKSKPVVYENEPDK